MACFCRWTSVCARSLRIVLCAWQYQLLSQVLTRRERGLLEFLNSRALLNKKAWLVVLSMDILCFKNITLLCLVRLTLFGSRCWLFGVFVHLYTLERFWFQHVYRLTQNRSFDLSRPSTSKRSSFGLFYLVCLFFLLRFNFLCYYRESVGFNTWLLKLAFNFLLKLEQFELHLVVWWMGFARTHAGTCFINRDANHPLVKLRQSR